MLTTVLLALLASNGTGKTLVRVQPGTVVPATGVADLASFPLVSPGCYATGSVMGTRGETLTVSRAGTRTCATATALVTCQANEACVETSGLLIEPTRTNVLRGSESLPPAYWSPDNAGTVTVAGGGPDGIDAMRVTVTAGGSKSGLYQLYSTSGARTLALSVWVKAGTQGSAASIGIQKDGVGGGCLNITPSSTWTRYNTVDVQTYVSGAYARVFPHANCGSGSGTGGDNVLFARAQMELGGYATSYIPAAASATARNADAISITNPWAASNPATFSVSATVTPESGRAWSNASSPAVLSGGTDGAANALRLYMDGSANIVGEVSQLAGTTAHGPYADGSEHTLCFGDMGGTLLMFSDAASKVLTIAGSGGTIASPPATLRLGAASTASTELGGYLRGLRFYRRPGCR